MGTRRRHVGSNLAGRAPGRRGACFAAALVACLAAAACSTDLGLDATSSGASGTTSVVVEPESFLGEVACGPSPGAMQAYVVTLTSWPPEGAPFVLGSSFPTPCSLAVYFRNLVVVGNTYTAEIDGYDRPASSLTAFGAPSSGSRQMYDVESGALVPPRWTGACGSGPSDGALASVDHTNFIPSCGPLVDTEPSPTAIVLAPDAALGPDPCGVAEVFDVTSPGLPAATAVACDAAPLVYETGVVAGHTYYFYVAARTSAALASPDLGTECFAVALAGQSVGVSCAPLGTTGAARISLDDLELGGAALCPPGQLFDVTLGGAPVSAAPVPCEGSAVVQPLDPGDYAFDIAVRDGGGVVTAQASCTATVLPGRTTDAVCAPVVL
ncbi:MAG: hypothetical protein IT373_19095 [Polyangiaceae bacterium]|nr:hypothetical protein [Polyangiaceae bacterium]